MDWLGTLGKIAPTVVAALGSPLAGAALEALGSLFGISEPTQDKIKKYLAEGQLTGEQVSKLQELEMQYKNEEAERGFKYAELEIRDRESARSRDATFVSSGRRNYRADLMFALAVGVVFWLVYIIWKNSDVSEYVKGIITLVLGRFLGYLDNIYNFEFGTTRGSEQKNELLAKAPSITGGK